MLLSREMAALRAGVSIATFARAVMLGQIKKKRLGRRTLFDPAEVDRWRESRKLPIATFRIEVAR
jgi:hypothetical protein